MPSLTVGSLFSGIGGIDLGLEQAGCTILWQVEIDRYCRRVLARHWPEVPCYADITTLDTSTLPRPDILAGGFPCQDISVSGRRAGLAGARSGLWREFLRCICDLRPPYVLVENVAALRFPKETEGEIQPAPLAQILGDLAGAGYDAEWTSLYAYQFGYPHYRERCFLVAYPHGLRHRRLLRYAQLCPKPPRPRSLSKLDLNRDLLQWFGEGVREPAIFGSAPGIPARVDRLHGLGNAVIPAMARLIGSCILRDCAGTEADLPSPHAYVQ